MTQTPQELAALALSRASRHYLQLSSVKSTYWLYPATEPSQGTIVFVHGYRGNHHGLEAIAGALPEFEIIIPDLPGFGEAEAFQSRHTVVAYANWLTEFMANINRPSAVILAHSFGTIITASAAHQGLANKLVLVNPVSAFERTGRDKLLENLTSFFYGVGGALPEPVGNRMLKNPVMVRLMSEVLAKTKSKPLRAWIHLQHNQNFSVFAERRVAIEGYASSISRSVASYARGIENDTLLIAGDKDDITPLADQQRLVRLFGNAQLEVIRGVGHLVHYETPAQAAELTREFISTHRD